MKKNGTRKRSQAAPPVWAMRDRVTMAGKQHTFHCVDGSGAPPLTTSYSDEAGRPALILHNSVHHQYYESRYGIHCIETEPWDAAHTVHIFEKQ